MYHVYFIESLKNGKIYCGMTEKTPEQRLKEHNNGSNEFTKKNGPFKMKYYEQYHCKQDALLREKFYKSGVGRKVRDSILNSFE